MTQPLRFIFGLLISLSSCQGSYETAFFVQGNCGACAPLIKNLVETVPGATLIDWSPMTNMALVRYRGSQEMVDTLQKRISEGGFETQYYPAAPEARQELPDCCQVSPKRFSSPIDSYHQID